ncbi:NADPH-dependent FMN reductase [Azospirillum sp. sgz302134]
MRILALCGSLRAVSAHRAALEAARLLAPEGVEITVHDGLDTLPHFNPDLEDTPPESVRRLRAVVGEHDGVLIACPEYARCLPGSFKNALDWLVGGFEFPGKPAALINASQRAEYVPDQLRVILTTIAARFVDEACVTLPLLGRPIDAAGIAADPALAEPLRAAVTTFAEAIRRLRAEAEADAAA